MWPRGLDWQPAIRPSYHWLHADGSVHTADGLRTGFTRDVRPGERILVPLEVVAPQAPGRYLLEVDLVHEDVRWFEQGCRVEIEVVEGSPLPPTGARLIESAPPPRRLRRPRLLIPRVLHRVWVGPVEMPAAFVEFGRGFERLHPQWEMRLWTDADLEGLGITDDERRRARSASELSNLVRYEVLARHGGVYVDTDFEAQAPARRPARAGSSCSPRSSCRAERPAASSAPCRATGRWSAPRGSRARRSGSDCIRPTPTARTS